MRTANMHEPKTHLSRLVKRAAGEPFINAKAGRPLVKVVPFDTQTCATKRLGFLTDEVKVPEDFKPVGADEIEHLFEHGS